MNAPARVKADANAMIPALRVLKKGEALIYHTGDLASDREKDSNLDQIADMAWALAFAGKIFLTQTRIAEPLFRKTLVHWQYGAGAFAYVATGGPAGPRLSEAVA